MTLATLAADAAAWIVLLAAGLATLRLALGPTAADRAVALEMLTGLTVAFAALHAVGAGEDAYLDASIALALTGFLSTLAFARYIAARGPEGGA